MTRQLRVRGPDAQFLLPHEDPFAVDIQAIVDLAPLALGPFLGRVMRACAAPVQ
jgi:hypothetical protein